jgi:hypothetical protein
MKSPDFMLFPGGKELRYDLITDKYQSHSTSSSFELTPSLRDLTTALQRWPVRKPINLGSNFNSHNRQDNLKA